VSAWSWEDGAAETRPTPARCTSAIEGRSQTYEQHPRPAFRGGGGRIGGRTTSEGSAATNKEPWLAAQNALNLDFLERNPRARYGTAADKATTPRDMVARRRRDPKDLDRFKGRPRRQRLVIWLRCTRPQPPPCRAARSSELLGRIRAGDPPSQRRPNLRLTPTGIAPACAGGLRGAIDGQVAG